MKTLTLTVTNVKLKTTLHSNNPKKTCTHFVLHQRSLPVKLNKTKVGYINKLFQKC